MSLRTTKPVVIICIVATTFWCYGQLTEVASAATGPSQISSSVRIVPVGTTYRYPTHTFLITHGMGGTRAGDRFHCLASKLAGRFPTANVWRIDWSARSQRTVLGLPCPWLVAPEIEPTAEEATDDLSRIDIDPSQMTMIGESFGNYVNFGVAQRLGGINSIIVLNPAHELGGYSPPDFRQVACRSMVIATRSPLDTVRKIADRSLLLETPPSVDPWKQHVYGIRWLSGTLERNDPSWVLLQRRIGPADNLRFDGVVLADGTQLGLQPRLDAKLEASPSLHESNLVGVQSAHPNSGTSPGDLGG